MSSHSSYNRSYIYALLGRLEWGLLGLNAKLYRGADKCKGQGCHTVQTFPPFLVTGVNDRANEKQNQCADEQSRRANEPEDQAAGPTHPHLRYLRYTLHVDTPRRGVKSELTLNHRSSIRSAPQGATARPAKKVGEIFTSVSVRIWRKSDGDPAREDHSHKPNAHPPPRSIRTKHPGNRRLSQRYRAVGTWPTQLGLGSSRSPSWKAGNGDATSF